MEKALKAFECSCLKLAALYIDSRFRKSARANRAIGLQFLLFSFSFFPRCTYLSSETPEVNNTQLC